jgi:tetratricopeptide (TPR) repeat protein
VKGRPLAWALTALLCLALVGQSVRGGSRLRATTLLGAVHRQMTAVQQLGRVPGPLVRATEATLVEAARLDPVAIEPLAFRGDLLLLAGHHGDAVAAYDRAMALELRPESLVHQGVALWRLGRLDEALVQLRRGIAVAPRLLASVPPAARERLDAAPPEPLPRPAAVRRRGR